MHAVAKRAFLTATACAAVAAAALPAVASSPASTHSSSPLASSRAVAASYSTTYYAKTAVRIHASASTSSTTLGIAYPGQKLIGNGLTTTGSSYPMVYIRDTATGVCGWVASDYLR